MISAAHLKALVDTVKGDARAVQRLFRLYHVAVTEARARGETIDFDEWLLGQTR